MVTHDPMPRASSPATWSAMSATSGEITTVSAPVLSYLDSAGIWLAYRLARARRQDR